MATAALQTEIGWIEVSADNDAITRLFWRGVQPARLQSSPLVKEAVKQLAAYFDKRLKEFDLPLAADGTGFAKDVWDIMLGIPYGQATSRRASARRPRRSARPAGKIRSPSSSRAIASSAPTGSAATPASSAPTRRNGCWTWSADRGGCSSL